MERDYKGRHILLDMYDCDAPEYLKHVNSCEDIMVAIAKGAGFSVVDIGSVQFQPIGCSVVLTLSESHMTIHTWPEDNCAQVDIFTCGDTDPNAAVPKLLELFKCNSYDIQQINRGRNRPVK